MASEATVDGVQSGVDFLRQMIVKCEAFVGAVEHLSIDNTQLRARCQQLEREEDELRHACERLREAHGAKIQALAELKRAHEELIREHEARGRALGELRDRHEALLRDRQSIVKELEGVLRTVRAYVPDLR